MAQYVHDLCKVSPGKRADMTDSKLSPAFSLGELQRNLFKLAPFSALWQEKTLLKQYRLDGFCIRTSLWLGECQLETQEELLLKPLIMEGDFLSRYEPWR